MREFKEQDIRQVWIDNQGDFDPKDALDKIFKNGWMIAQVAPLPFESTTGHHKLLLLLERELPPPAQEKS